MQQHIEHIRMGFLYLVKKDNRVRFAANSFSQLTTFVITDISRRRTNQTRGTEFLLVLGHIDTSHHVLIIEEVIRQCFG